MITKAEGVLGIRDKTGCEKLEIAPHSAIFNGCRGFVRASKAHFVIFKPRALCFVGGAVLCCANSERRID